MNYPRFRLSDVADIERHGVDPTTLGGDVSYVGLEDITGDGAVLASSTAVGDLASTKFRFTERHILFGKLRPYLRKTARPDFGGVCSTDIIPILPRERVDRSYLHHFLRTDEVVERATSMSSGANLPRISPRHLADFEVPLPPLDEQRRIAAILDQADAMRRNRRAAMAQLNRMERAVFVQTFGSPEENPQRHPLIAFGSVIADGPTNGLYKPATDYGDGTPILRIGDFYDGRVEKLDDLRRLRTTERERATYALKEDDIVINRVNSREYLGKSALIPPLEEETVFESNMMRLRLDRARVEPRYGVSFLQTPFLKRQILLSTKDAVNQSSINQADVRKFIVMLPSIEQQRGFAERVEEIETMISRHAVHAAHLDALFASLQQRAFTGEL